MPAKILSAACVGLDALPVEVEADTGGGQLGSFAIVGLPDLAVQEAKERVRSAIRNTGLEFPKIKITVNLAPADLKKQGPSYDLPIAVSVLAAAAKGRLAEAAEGSLFIGELALSGRVRPVNGVLPIALAARQWGVRAVYVPEENAAEARLAPGLKVFAVTSLRALLEHLTGKTVLPEAPAAPFVAEAAAGAFDMALVQGQEHVKRALEIAAAGGHNLLMSGPPGSGKTMLARAIPSILPDLVLEEALELTKIYSVAGHLPSGQALVTKRPFRSPHHTASAVALVGGGSWPKPGEISLAHRGVLFLDEFPEFSRASLENLRQPLEDGVIHVSRAAGTIVFPAKVMLVAAMNPCPCGHADDPDRPCICSAGQIMAYQKKISGPILDRIDLHVEVPRLPVSKLEEVRPAESSAAVKQRVSAARGRQLARRGQTGVLTNGELPQAAVKRFCRPDEAGLRLLSQAVERLRLSARSYYRVERLARTIADLAGSQAVTEAHVAEALQYRPRTE